MSISTTEYNPHVKRKEENVMREIMIEKVVVNIGVGEGGERLLRAKKALEILTGHKPVETIAKVTNRDFGIRKGMAIGCKVTLRGKDAYDFLRRALWVKEFKVDYYSFDDYGNFSFGIPDHTLFEGIKYDPEIGIFGMDINGTFRRRGGWRVARRQRCRKKIPKKHRVTLEEALQFLRKNFNVEVVE